MAGTLSVFQFPCGNCGKPLAVDNRQPDALTACPACGQDLLVAVFPAYLRKDTVVHADRVIVDGQSTCFFHPESQASVPCDQCGRFLCPVCDIAHREQHYCAACFQSAVSSDQHDEFKREYMRYDEIALLLAIAPMLIFYLTLITAPISLYYCIRYWRKPMSIIYTSKWRFVLAGLLASLQIAGWIAGITMAVNAFTAG